MFGVVALIVAGSLAVLSMRSMALAFTSSVNAHTPDRTSSARANRKARGYLASGEAAVLIFDILLSVGIALLIVGLTATAALPGRLMAGALLAQVAVLGSLVAPPIVVSYRQIDVRPIAVALCIAQLANFVFFVRAMESLT